MDRSEFLARVEVAAAAAILPDHPSKDPGQWVPDLPDVDLVDRFTEVAENMAAEVRTGPVDEVISQIVERHDIHNYISWDADRIDGIDRLPDHLRRITTETPRGPEGRAAHNAGFMECQLGITGAEAAFAETGTIVVRSGPGQPRMASLVPLVHIAVLRKARIFRSASHWAADPSAQMSQGSNVVFITGPSKTADIESIVTLGVHGPKHLYIALV